MKVRIKVQPTGLLNAKPWPEVGDTIEVPDVVALDLLEGGWAEAVKGRNQAVEAAVPAKVVETADLPVTPKPRRGRPPKEKAES